MNDCKGRDGYILKSNGYTLYCVKLNKKARLEEHRLHLLGHNEVSRINYISINTLNVSTCPNIIKLFTLYIL